MPDSEQQQPANDPPRKRRDHPNGLLTALIIGTVAGILSAISNIALTFANAATYQAIVREASDQVTSNTYAIFGLACLNFFFILLACFLAGFIVGKVAIQRRLGFYAGMLGAAITYAASFLVRYIPNYPGNLPAQSPAGGAAVTGAIMTVLIFLLIWIFIGGMLGLCGSWAATRRHPYYRG
jgi:uncharacterized BrkB/YihY/UPF0761 family membrane protein